MKISTVFVVLATVSSLLPARAEVTDVAGNGFTSVNEAVVAAPRSDAWRAAVHDIGAWWSPDHTVAGDASRLTIDDSLLGCFCERFDAQSGVVHLTVTMINPEVVLRMTGGLGPLGLMGVEGNMTWEFDDADGGTRVRFTYAVGGYRAGGFEALAGAVDGVLGDALGRFARYVERGSPEEGDDE